MKRIQFIAPVESVRGNLSGKQDLRYAENDNKAYEAPRATKNYARNYRPSFIGAKIAATGRTYFAVKTKSCTHVTQRWLKAAALLGGAGAMFATILRQKSTIYEQLLMNYEQAFKSQYSSFRQYVMDGLRLGLKQKKATIVFGGPTVANIDNPWVKVAATVNVPVSREILVKFWEQLANNPITFTVDGKTGVAHDGDVFSMLVTSSYNVLEIESVSAAGENYIKMDGLFVKYEDEFVDTAFDVEDGGDYFTTDEQPS